MAHLMPIAGMPTELSEHFVFYHVIPKPTQRVWCRAEMVNICSIRPKFVCFSHSAVENREVCKDRRQCRHQARHGAVKCSCLHCRRQATGGCCLNCCREGAEVCCLHATKDVGEQCRLCMVKHIAKRNRSDCCISKNQLPLRAKSCDMLPLDYESVGDHIRATDMQRPGCDDHSLEMRMWKKLNKLESDIQKFDEALKHLQKERRPYEQRCLAEGYKTCGGMEVVPSQWKKCLPCNRRETGMGERKCLHHNMICDRKESVPAEWNIVSYKVTCDCKDSDSDKWKCFPVVSRRTHRVMPFYGRKKSEFRRLI